MNTKHFLYLALAAALSTTAFAATAQPIDPTVAPTAGQTEAAEDLDVDRRCLEATGSRVTADPQPATARDNTERDGPDCAIGNGTVHTRKDIDRTGATNIEDALRALDPRLL